MKHLKWSLAGGICTVLLAACISACGTQSGATDAPSNAPVSSSNNHASLEGMDAPIPANQLPALMRRARAGDNQAAEDLGYHFGNLHQRIEEKRWFTLAAMRGQCRSIAALGWIAYLDRDRATYDRWNDTLREHRCTLGNLVPEVLNEMDRATPAWDDQPDVLWNDQ